MAMKLANSCPRMQARDRLFLITLRPVGLELPILALIPGLHNVALRIPRIVMSCWTNPLRGRV
jgi:hypothetical protein